MAANSADDAADEDKPMKKPMNPTKKLSGKSEAINIPAIMLDYDKHGEGLLTRKDVEVDQVCEYKQGYVGLITGKPIPADDLSLPYFI